MATRLFSDLVNRIAPSVHGCPQPVIINYIRDAAIEACERTLLWRYEQATITLVAGTYKYAYVPPDADSEVHAVLTASVNGSDLPANTIEEIHRQWPKYPSTVVTERSTPQRMVHITPNEFYIVPVPDGDTTYTVEMFVALKPTRTATGMDQGVLNELETTIMSGALQQLFVLPEQTWSDRELAAYHAKQFAYQIAGRRASANVGAGRAVVSARAAPWA